MKQAIDELKAIPGVVGACLFSSQGGLLQCNLPGIFKADKLTEVSRQLSKLLAAGRMSFSDMNDIALHYDESVVIARELRKGLVVFAVCDPSFNHNLLTMSLNLLQDDLHDQPDPAPQQAAEALAGVSSVSVAEELEPVLEELKQHLAKILGPMAGIVFDEILQDWAQQGASNERLPALIELLNAEIGDQDKVAAYGDLVAPVLKG